MARLKAKISARRASRRRATKRAAVRKTRNGARMRTKPRRPQRFVVSHHREKDFEGGLRSYAKYRDLGIVKATNGMVRAHVIRFVPPCRPEEVSAALSRRRFPDGLRAQRLDQDRARGSRRDGDASGKRMDPAAAHRARGAR